jgi:hypothetical protein
VNALKIRFVKLPLHSTSENGDLDPTACLLIKLLATSKQVLGSHHNVTKEVELELQEDDEDNAFVCHTKI